MDPLPTAFGVLLIAVLVALAGFFGWRQVRQLRGLRDGESMPAAEHQYLRRQAWRRLFGCLLMIVLAGLLCGAFALQDRVRELGDELSFAREENGEEPELTDEQRQFRTAYTVYVIVLLLVLLAFLVTAAVDLLAIRRFTLGQQRKIVADRRAMIERQVARYRRERNGHA